MSKFAQLPRSLVQVEWPVLGPADRHVRRLAPSPDHWPKSRVGLGIQRSVCTRVPGHITGYSQPSCPAPPSAQAEWTVLGPAGRHVRRLAPSPDRRNVLWPYASVH